MTLKRKWMRRWRSTDGSHFSGREKIWGENGSLKKPFSTAHWTSGENDFHRNSADFGRTRVIEHKSLERMRFGFWPESPVANASRPAAESNGQKGWFFVRWMTSDGWPNDLMQVSYQWKTTAMAAVYWFAPWNNQNTTRRRQKNVPNSTVEIVGRR